MEKILDNLFPEYLHPVILYKDDLFGLIDIIGKDKLLTFEADSFNFLLNNGVLEEIESKKFPKVFAKKIKIKSVISDDNILTINFDDRFISIHAYKENPESLGVASKIKKYLESKKRVLSFLKNPYNYVIAGIFSIVVGSLLYFPLYFYGIRSLIILLLLVIAFQQAVFFSLVYILEKKQENIIYIKYTREEVPNFWQKKKHDILMVLVSFIVGIIGTIITQYLLRLSEIIK